MIPTTKRALEVNFRDTPFRAERFILFLAFLSQVNSNQKGSRTFSV